MTSSDEKRPRYRRRLVWLAVFIVILFGGYSAAWFYFAGLLEREVETALVSASKGGVSAECANPTARGFPFRIGLYCDNVAYSDDSRGVVAKAGSFRSAAQVYQPTRIVAELDGPFRSALPGLPPLWLDWDKLRTSIRLAAPFPERISLETEGLSGQADPDGNDPVQLFSVTSAETHLRPNGADLDWAATFTELRLDPASAGGRTLPVFDGTTDMTLKDGIRLIQSEKASLRGQAVDIHRLDLNSGTGGFSVRGPVSIGADGLVDARLTLSVRDPKALAATLSTAFPEAKDKIDGTLLGFAALGNEASLPFTIAKGKMSLAFIPLGNLPPL